MKLLFVCIASLIHFSAAIAPAPLFTAGLNEIPQFTGKTVIEILKSDQAELDSFQKTLYKSDNLPSTCGFQFSIWKLQNSIIWEINCQARQHTYVKCVDGDIANNNQEVTISIDQLKGKANTENCPQGKQSLLAVEELTHLLPSNNPKTLKLYDYSYFEIFRNWDKNNGIRTSFFDVFLSSEVIQPSQVPSLGYYGKYGYRASPKSIRELTTAVNIINKISIIDIQTYLKFHKIDRKIRLNIKRILKKHYKFRNFVPLLKHLYRKVVHLSQKVEKTNKELVEMMHDIVDLVALLGEIEDDDIISQAISALIKGRWMTKTIS